MRTQTGITNQAIGFLKRHRLLKKTVKTVFDYTIVLPALLFLSPFLLIVTLLILIESPGPVFFRRRVLGLNGREFNAFKFRTMYINSDDRLIQNRQQWVAVLRGQKVGRDPRYTRIGWFLRRTGLEELPRLLNILNREMSLVGPRALTRQDLLKYGRHNIDMMTAELPGLIGPGALLGLNIPLKDQLKLDMEYSNNWSVWLDVKILFGTFSTALKSQPI